MIRAHLATFPARAGIVMRTIASILPQVDRLCVCLNQHQRVPEALADDPRIEVLIPDRDLKDAGKFAFPAAPDDVVFTIDDDILYPPDYVARTLSFFDKVDPGHHVLGHLGHLFQRDPRTGQWGWKNWMFQKRAGRMIKVDLVGTGTSCQLGRNLPPLEAIEDAAGFVDLRHARLHHEAGRWLWLVPHERDWMISTMTPDLDASSLFRTVNARKGEAVLAENRAMLLSRTRHGGQTFRALRQQGVIPGTR